MPKRGTVRRRGPGLAAKLMVAVLVPSALLLAAEGAAGIYLVKRYGPEALARFHRTRGTSVPPPAVPLEYQYSLKTRASTDPCTGRDITYTVNSRRKRGPEWSPRKSPGALRVLAVGSSTTWGVNNPDWATWPALLEKALSRRLGRSVEVMNGGVPKQRMATIMRELPHLLEDYRPDVVIYYEAFNDAIAYASDYEQVNVSIGTFHQTWLGRLTHGLHYRSVLYTTLLEKIYFARARRDRRLVPDVRNFEGWIGAFVDLVRSERAVPVVALQVTALPPAPGLEQVALHDAGAVQAFLLEAMEHRQQASDEERRWRGSDGLDLRATEPWAKRWAYQTQVLVEAARRTGEAKGVQVIDPRPAFLRYPGSEPLFCDVIHLTDQGNQVLADAIASEWR